MRLRGDCKVVSFRGHHLLTTGSKSLEINQSFAEILKIALKGAFTVESLASELIQMFDMETSEATIEASNLIDTLKNHDLLDGND